MTPVYIAREVPGDRLWLGVQLMVEAFRRARPRVPAVDMAHIGSAACDDAAYSLDAPGTFPAGACRSYFFDDDDLPAVVEQVVCEREAA